MKKSGNTKGLIKHNGSCVHAMTCDRKHMIFMWSVNESSDYWPLLSISFKTDQWFSAVCETNEFCIDQRPAQYSTES
jgi:hypothetical protein